MCGLILVPIPTIRVEISIDEPQFRWMREHGTLHIPDVRAQNDFPDRFRSDRRSRLGRCVIGTLARRRGASSPRRRSNCSKPSPIRRSSPSRTCGCSRNSASATRNCARRWSIRRRRPRCSASSAARRPTCSRSSTPSSRAPRGFVGSMTWCCDSRGEHYGSAGSFWSHTHWPRRDQYG